MGLTPESEKYTKSYWPETFNHGVHPFGHSHDVSFVIYIFETGSHGSEGWRGIIKNKTKQNKKQQQYLHKILN